MCLMHADQAYGYVSYVDGTGTVVTAPTVPYASPNVIQSNTSLGTGARIAAGTGAIYDLPSKGTVNSPSYSLFAVGSCLSTSAIQSAMDMDNSAGRYFQFRIDSGKVDLIPFNSSKANTGRATSPVAMTLSEMSRGFTMGGVVSPTRTVAFQNGVLIPGVALTGAPVTPGVDIALRIGSRQTGTQLWNTGGLMLVVVWTRAIADAEMVSLSDNPWQLFKPPQRRMLVAYSDQSGVTVVSAAGSSTGTASLSSLAAAVYNAFGSSGGTSTLSSSTLSLFYTSGNASGSATNAANGISVYLTSGSSTSTATVSGNAYSVWSVQANTAGSSDGAGSSAALVPVSGGTAGTSSVAGEGSALTPASGTSSGTAVGTSSAAAIASAFYNAIASAVGSASASGSGASTNSTTANASGSASGLGNGVARVAASGTTSGTSEAGGGGVILACASGAATGLANVGGLSVAIYGADGISVSAAQVQAIAASVASAFANAEGRSTVSGVTEGGLHYTASGDKFSITLTLSPYKLKLNAVPFKMNYND